MFMFFDGHSMDLLPWYTLKILSSSCILGPTSASVSAIILHGPHHLYQLGGEGGAGGGGVSS